MIALVAIDLDVPHLDHPFEYSIPEGLEVGVGSRVSVNFAGRRQYGWVTGLTDTSASGRSLQPIRRVVGPFPLVTSGVIRTAEYLSARYATNLKQILSFAIPTRRASVEKEFGEQIAPEFPDKKVVPRRLVTSLYPGQMLSAIESATREREKREIVAVVVPTSAAARRVEKYLEAALPELRIALADAEQSDAQRYRVHLRALAGEVDVVVGTRSAVWTPMPAGGAIVVWDDGDDRLKERRSPRFDALDVAVARSHVERVRLLCASYARSVKAQALVESSWAQDTSPDRALGLTLIPRTRVFDWADAGREGASGYSRLPDSAYRVIREGLTTGRPVLVQVASAGYATEVQCPLCHLPRDAEPNECPHPSHEWGARLRIGSDRIRDELQRAFLDFPVVASSSTAGIIDEVEASPRIVVATTSSEPHVKGGYGSIVIAEAESVVYTDSLDAQLEAERRWMGALALSAPRAPAIIVGTLPESLEQSIVRWQPEILAVEELRTRTELGFPPSRWLVSVTGEPQAVEEAADAVHHVANRAEACQPKDSEASIAVVSLSSPYREEGKTVRRLIASSAPRMTGQLMSALRQVQIDRSKNGMALLLIEVNPSQVADSS
ncbi:hypothetical protein U6G28_09265 [Actinomycetaceae bacterium MB13-C1-2]|nr:hypothetical protein U6G28_09265 [Actinomycetaceae bacterium MB13-C1-2]